MGGAVLSRSLASANALTGDEEIFGLEGGAFGLDGELRGCGPSDPPVAVRGPPR